MKHDKLEQGEAALSPLKRTICTVGLGTILFFHLSTPLPAHERFSDEEVTVDLQGWMQAGYAIVEGGDPPHGTYVKLARLKGSVSYGRWGWGVLQIGHKNEKMRLLDLVAAIEPTEGLSLRFGKFKAASSLEYLISAPRHPFVNRALLVGLTQRRLIGAEIGVQRHFERMEAALRAGWFETPATLAETLGEEKGKFLNLRGRLAFPSGITLHAAYLDFLLARNAPPSGEDAPEGGEMNGTPSDSGNETARPLPYDRQLDAAIAFEKDGWRAFAEGMLVLDGPAGSTPIAFYLMALRMIPLPHVPFTLEPGVRYEIFRPETDVWTHRITAGLTWHLHGDRLYVRTNYEMSRSKGSNEAAGYLQLQAGF